jgi:hypothetical protein
VRYEVFYEAASGVGREARENRWIYVVLHKKCSGADLNFWSEEGHGQVTCAAVRMQSASRLFSQGRHR